MRTITVTGALLVCAITLAAQGPGDRLRNAAAEPHNWLTYSGTYSGQRYSTLRQIDGLATETIAAVMALIALRPMRRVVILK